MTSEDERGSLADAAAAWVPPWDRPKPPAADDQDRPAPEGTDARAADPAVRPAGDAGVGADEAAGVRAGAAATEPPAGDGSVPGSGDVAEPVTGDGPERVPGASATVGDGASPPVSETEPSRAAAVPLQKSKPQDTTAEVAGGAASEARAAPKRRRAKPKPAEPEPDPVSLIDDAELRGALEAILLVVDEPVAEVMLSQVLEQPTERVTQMLYLLSGEYTDRGHGFDLRRVAGGWRLYTRPEYAAYVERFVLDGQTARLTQAALETLAVVAYKQPCSRSQVSAIRGVNCDGVMRTLVTRGLVEECGADVSGAYLYKTTTLFLEKLGIDSVAQLPPLAPFLPDNVEEIVTDA
ncbi:SMC-Scp complex subunit ScpB [Catenuloplanes indicus]|uniref:Segregation and condensation protein B n=1 Tax=Catenuloplanes indicus TaxID=137267 RepID=A0AAE3W874_9ACTN|nr:SMC-Scp complex subunit ScpB [Catenuloplanes indicus]MDQ0370255.1 segregation and condensation protein B [Catenuloplanes indicus]